MAGRVYLAVDSEKAESIPEMMRGALQHLLSNPLAQPLTLSSLQNIFSRRRQTCGCQPLAQLLGLYYLLAREHLGRLRHVELVEVAKRLLEHGLGVPAHARLVCSSSEPNSGLSREAAGMESPGLEPSERWKVIEGDGRPWRVRGL